MKIIETERLILRTWCESDVEIMAAINQDPKVCEYLPGPLTYEETKAAIERFVRHYKKHGFCLYAAEIKLTQQFIGWIGLSIPAFSAHFMPAVEIAWRLDSKHWNQGYATEGAKAVRDYAFTTLNLDEIVSFTTIANKASRRVMEKIGMHHNKKDDFFHPKLDRSHPICKHVLYRLPKREY